MTEDVSYYKAEFSISRSVTEGFDISSAQIIKSMPMDFNPTIRKVVFFPEHHLNVHPEWPDFYFIVTGTRAATPIELETSGEDQRTSDGLLISEFFFRKVDRFELMEAPRDISKIVI